ncbi:endonuclease [Fulvitalea axinellae]|uniref:Endonuclease n=1 Tax=Fulvitalea axinellae TaxID=1182444 RepID=A0AAU9D9G4_9BACT|nr:endonuclease [Fulvitalea axinellae]
MGVRHYLVGLILIFSITAQAQEKKSGKAKALTVGFYNMENLFDIYDDPATRDSEYTPEGKNNWTKERYQRKLTNMATVISKIGADELGSRHGAPSILGICEAENLKVIEDLVSQPELKSKNYGIVHQDSPDRRGIDVALLYKKKDFVVENARWAPLKIKSDEGEEFFTREQLVVSGKLENGEELHVIVNHWPSRYGGEKRSRPKRNAAADLTRSLVDSISAVKPGAKIVVMGDLNDDPDNASVKKHLRTKGDRKKLQEGDLYNPYETYFKKGIGTLAYRDNWNLFDQLILTQPLIDKNSGGYYLMKAKIFNKKFLKQQEGRYKGYPWRTFAGGRYSGGYGDHFPVYMILVREL